MTIKNAEKAKKSKRPKIFQKHLEFIVNSMSRCTVIRTLGVNVLKKILWDPRRSKIRDF